MKIRQGFVSNSSTSSFLMYGIGIDSIEDLIKALGMPSPEENEYENDLAIEALLSKKLGKEKYKTIIEKNKIEFFNYPEDEGWWIGASWATVKDDETGKQFKERIQKAIDDTFKEKIKCNTHEEAWGNY